MNLPRPAQPLWLRAFAVALLLGTLVTVGALRLTASGHGSTAIAALDFRAFYCAGEAVRTRYDPYRLEPLRTCENRVAPDPGRAAWGVTPAPFPGYAMTLFVALSTLPYPLAHAVWIGLMVGAWALAAMLLAELAAWPVLATAAALVPTGLLLSLYLGEPTPLAIAAFVGAASLAAGGRWRGCAVALGAAMIEPHIALPALVALAIAVPRARLAVAGVVAGLGALSLLTIGLALNVEYVRDVLPIQALAEVAAADQYSLTHLLASLGVAPATALRLGSLSYAAAAAAGIALAVRLRGSALGDAALVLVPGAAALIGGTFVHDTQLATAIPAAVVVAEAVRRRNIGIAALVGLGFSFMVLDSRENLVLTVAAAAAVGTAATLRRPRAALLAAAASFALAVGIGRLPHTVGGAPGMHAAAAPAQSIAGTTWGREIRAMPSMHTDTPQSVVSKLPGWLGLWLIIALACIDRRRAAAVNVNNDPRHELLARRDDEEQT